MRGEPSTKEGAQLPVEALLRPSCLCTKMVDPSRGCSTDSDSNELKLASLLRAPPWRDRTSSACVPSEDVGRLALRACRREARVLIVSH